MLQCSNQVFLGEGTQYLQPVTLRYWLSVVLVVVARPSGAPLNDCTAWKPPLGSVSRTEGRGAPVKIENLNCIVFTLIVEPAGEAQRFKRNSPVRQATESKAKRRPRGRLYGDATARATVIVPPKTVPHMPSPGVMYTPQLAVATPVK